MHIPNNACYHCNVFSLLHNKPAYYQTHHTDSRTRRFSQFEVLAPILANLTDSEFRKAQREVEDVAKGRYDSKIDRSGSIHR